jgi:hypothetical protein
VGGTVGFDSESELMDGDMMVEPAKSYEVVGVVGSAVDPMVDVVWLCR